MSRGLIRIAPLPPTSGLSPYYALFYGALAPHGIGHVPDAEWDIGWFSANRDRVDWAHFHWVSGYYQSLSRLLAVRRAAALARFVRELHRLGIGVLWTLHNLFPHEWRSRAVDWAVRVTLAHQADVVIAPSQHARRQLARYFWRTRNVVTVLHGHVADHYPNTVSREEARRRLGLSREAFVYLLLGALRPYKGAEELIASFRAIADERSILLVAGQPLSGDYARWLRASAGEDPRVRLMLDAVPDEEVQLHFNAADLATFPYRRILSSGSVILSQSPVLVPDMPSLREYVMPGSAYLIPRGQRLSEALCRAKQEVRDGRIRGGAELIASIRRLDWGLSVEPLVPLLERRLTSAR
jgi:glycosyltransferase involved in cell wall biosynthesis